MSNPMLRTAVTAGDKGFPWIKLVVLVGGTVGALVIAVAAAYVWVGVSTGDAVAATDKFLTAIKSGDTQQAYAYTSSEFRSAQDQETFESTMGVLALSGYSVGGWTSRIIPKSRDGHDLIKGTLSTPADDDMPFFLTVVQENGDWKIVSFVDKWRQWLDSGAWFKQTPPEEKVRELVVKSMNDFAAAIGAKDLRAFYDAMSPSFTIKNAFAAFEIANSRLVDNNVDLSAVSTLTPIYDEPPEVQEQAFGGGRTGAISAGGGISVGVAGRNTGKAEIAKDTVTLLTIKGRYPAQPDPILFQLRYGYNHPGWVLHSIFVDVPKTRAK